MSHLSGFYGTICTLFKLIKAKNNVLSYLPENIWFVALAKDVNCGLALPLVLVDALRHQPGLGLEHVLAVLTVPHHDPVQGSRSLLTLSTSLAMLQIRNRIRQTPNCSKNIEIRSF